ncbi:PepSY-associated TM helix domain-containing protein [Pseudogracilibacillus auburnensis]|uniref:PepSY-associated TM helix domain-containing protein n=1 Tax=Pseudogracilibacillus auburnensis TaxID=1494959 RepID=UPI001A96B820|nr:PepSY-associated TM helix domain-containing protein [Pseudogracilibacillus auburnensis]MBO1004992.1 PepSY-associated TM helix domain-containing protein [Pseudogracilibacillus auburnensis]
MRKTILNVHLYVGLILSVTILMLSVTGLYLNHQHDWFHKQNIHYINPNYDEITEEAIQLAHQGERNVPNAVEVATTSNLFTIEDIVSVNYAYHGLGYFYYVHLNDELGTIAVVTEQGEVAKLYSDPAIKKWMHDLHTGIVDGFNFIFINDITTVGIILLTVTGIILSFRILKARTKVKRKYKTN